MSPWPEAWVLDSAPSLPSGLWGGFSWALPAQGHRGPGSRAGSTEAQKAPALLLTCSAICISSLRGSFRPLFHEARDLGSRG